MQREMISADAIKQELFKNAGYGGGCMGMGKESLSPILLSNDDGDEAVLDEWRKKASIQFFPLSLYVRVCEEEMVSAPCCLTLDNVGHKLMDTKSCVYNQQVNPPVALHCAALSLKSSLMKTWTLHWKKKVSHTIQFSIKTIRAMMKSLMDGCDIAE